MINEYLENITNIGTKVLFFLFKYSVFLLVILLIISLILLIIGCLIKSQKIKMRFLKSSISILLTMIFILIIPVIAVKIKSLI